jgi:hypothetical protein
VSDFHDKKYFFPFLLFFIEEDDFIVSSAYNVFDVDKSIIDQELILFVMRIGTDKDGIDLLCTFNPKNGPLAFLEVDLAVIASIGMALIGKCSTADSESVGFIINAHISPL